MNRQELFAAICATRSDGRMSSTEKAALRDAVQASALSMSSLHALRSDIFDRVAGQGTCDARTVHWLEQVVQILERPKPEDRAKPTVSSEAWFGPEDPMVEQLESMIEGARISIDLAVFTLTDDRLKRALIRAHARGVRVRILSDNDKAYDRGSDIHALTDAGLAVHVDRSPYHFHHKFAIFDAQYLVCGSYNWTRGADQKNRENFLRTGDTKLVHAYEDAFHRMWLELS